MKKRKSAQETLERDTSIAKAWRRTNKLKKSRRAFVLEQAEKYGISDIMVYRALWNAFPEERVKRRRTKPAEASEEIG